ncbi:TIGR04222 domain-containing membrane protein [Streptomyces sp. RerS4]|uniref:TIGR04222 domain-containing membrane protein n=1 Tax=Streptomyces sp. RerS4 TaxID=2942449 RepID=UPI00201CA043|nr:TIGR04222 domain-containing membrane protein [Streptomyces sp. RerS4]UQX03604.1 TIGR04222 domain-containing membrane protein [Streptomyces sp. RerS4]
MNAFDLLAVAVWVAVIASTALLLRGLHRSRSTVTAAAPTLHDLSEAAFLAGGPGAVIDAALVSLLGDGRLTVGGPGIVRLRYGAQAVDPAERAVVSALLRAPSGWLYQVRYAAMLDPAVQEVGDGLAARGLLLPPGTGRRWRLWGIAQAVVCGVWVPLSIPLTFVAWAVEPDSQVPFLVKVFPALLIGIVVGAACAKGARQRLTPAGRQALAAMRARYAGDPNPAVATALFGLAGLSDPYLREQLVPAARSTRLAAAQARGHGSARGSRLSSGSSEAFGEVVPVLWCAGSDGGGSGGGGGCGSGSSGSSCSSSSGSGCSSSSGSSCAGSSSGSSCSSSSSSS